VWTRNSHVEGPRSPCGKPNPPHQSRHRPRTI
jgi:hypothetical protein